MSETLSIQIERLEKAFDNIERETPFLRPIAKAFREIIISRAVLKSRLSERPDIYVSPPDLSRFSEGMPWLSEETLTSFVEPWGDNVRLAVKPLVKAFPSTRLETLRLKEAFERGTLDLKYCISAIVEGREDDIIKIAAQLGFHPTVLKFILGQILKPFVEKRTESLRPIIKDLPWHQGYCPICGAYPELSFLQKEEGQRWLRCSLCGYDWRFDRMSCPYCGGKNEGKEFITIDSARHEWLELCPECHRYIVGFDIRGKPNTVIEVAAIGLVHLDVIAQGKGFHPIAECAWNLVPPSN